MDLKIVLIISVLIYNQFCNGQERKISCKYQLNYNLIYECQLTLSNLNGSDNFKNISGTHKKGYSDEDVYQIYSWYIETKNIPKIICEKFKNIQNIKFPYHRFPYFQTGFDTLKNCKNLSSLTISFDSMKKIEENIFDGLDKLKILDLKNEIKWPENLFSTNQNLEVLSLSSNKIFDLPENIFKSLENLQDLNLSKNKILNLRHKWFANLRSLTSLNLNENGIRELPKDIFVPLKNLRTIKLASNLIQIIHSNSFGILPELTFINLAHNQINAIDEQFIDNTGVTDIKLSDNKCLATDFFDNSTTRDALVLELNKCITNYEIIQNRKLYKMNNNAGSEQEKTNKIMLQILSQMKDLTNQSERQNESQKQEIETLYKDLQILNAKIEFLLNENEELRSKVHDLTNMI